ncbi:MAG: TetR/AcrR family transcriptional regulator [Longimicrobiales bacterium]
MSPRPKKASDQVVFAAVQRVMQQVGPGDLTLARIAKEAGVTAGALVQRFGSKRDLLLKLMEAWSGSGAEMFAQLQAHYHSPLATLYGYADCMAQMGGTPAEFAHHLSYLQMDLTDPVFHRHVKKQAVATRTSLRQLLDDAVREGELVSGLDTRALARQVEVTITGSLWNWAFYQEGRAADWMREDLEALLGPLRRVSRRASRRKVAARKKRT